MTVDWSVTAVVNPTDAVGLAAYPDGVIGTLAYPGDLQVSFGYNAEDTCSFSVISRHQDATKLLERVTDVVLRRYENGALTLQQRFRVISSTDSKQGGVRSTQFAGVSYRAMLERRVFHSGDKRRWPSTDAAGLRLQSAMAWRIVSDMQAKSAGDYGIIQGTTGTAYTRGSYTGTDATGSSDSPGDNAFEVGSTISQALDTLADFADATDPTKGGFTWDVDVDGSGNLVFNMADREVVSPDPSQVAYTLADSDTGSSVIESWTVSNLASDYANVVYAPGSIKADPPVQDASWWPTSENPGGTPREGRWEKQVTGDNEVKDHEALVGYAAQQYIQLHGYTPTWSMQLQRGVWHGRADLWTGDWARVLVDLGRRVEDQVVQVQGISVSFSRDGAEDVSLVLANLPLRKGRAKVLDLLLARENRLAAARTARRVADQSAAAAAKLAKEQALAAARRRAGNVRS